MRLLTPTLLTMVIFGSAAYAQSDLPKDLPELVAALPALVHSNKMNWPSYCESVTAAYKRNPASLREAAPILARNLSDHDQTVEFDSLTIIHGLAMEAKDTQVILGAESSVASLVATGSKYVQNMALVNISDLGDKAPDDLVAPVRNLLASEDTDQGIRTAAADVLMISRGHDDDVQTQIIKLIDDPSRPALFRNQLLFATAKKTAGQKSLEHLTAIANTSEDKQMRDTAISGAMLVGPAVLDHIEARLKQIAEDPSESQASRGLSQRALKAKDRYVNKTQ